MHKYLIWFIVWFFLCLWIWFLCYNHRYQQVYNTWYDIGWRYCEKEYKESNKIFDEQFYFNNLMETLYKIQDDIELLK